MDRTQTRHFWPLAVLFLLVAAGLRLWNLGGPSLWYDEAYTWWLATQISSAEAVTSSLHEFIPPGTYFAWRGWVALTGTSELALRALSALPGVLAAAAAARVAGRLSGSRRVALATLVACAIAPPLVSASHVARMYGPLLGTMLPAQAALVEAILGPARLRRRWAWLWGALMLMTLYALAPAAFWLAGQGALALLLLIRRPNSNARWAVVRALWAPTLLGGLLFLVWLVPALRHLEENYGFWPGFLTLRTFFARTVLGTTVSDLIRPTSLASDVGAAILGLTVAGLLLAAPRPRAWLAVTLTGLLPPLLAAVPYQHVPKYELQHTVLFASPIYLALGLAWQDGVATPQRRQLRLAARLATVLAALPMLWADGNLLFNPAFAREDWRGAATYVQAHRVAPRPAPPFCSCSSSPISSDIVIIETGSAAPAWIYYAGREDLLPLPQDPLLDVRHVLHYTNTAPLLNQHLSDRSGVWVVGWLKHVTDPTDIVTTLLEQIGEEQSVPQFHGLSLRYFKLKQTPSFPPLPPATERLDSEMLPGLSLWGVTLPQTPVPADQPLRVLTWWTTPDATMHRGRAYQASLRLIDNAGHEWGRVDAPPGGGDHRPEHWPADTPILGQFVLTPTLGTPPGVYTATLRLYQLGGETSPAIPVGRITLERPTTPPPLPPWMDPIDSGPSTNTPLRLLGIHVDRDTVRPCESLPVALFWEVADTPLEDMDIRLVLNEAKLAPDWPIDLGQARPGDRFLMQATLPIGCRARAYTGPLQIALIDQATGHLMDAWRGPSVSVAIQRTFTPPTDIAPLTAEFGDGLAHLIGVRIEQAGDHQPVFPPTLDAETPFTITLAWQAGAVIDTPYTVFVHITPPDAPSPLTAQDDAWPAQGTRPTPTWVPGEVVLDAHPLPGLPPGNYRVRVGLYGPDGARLACTPVGPCAPDDAVDVATLQVR